MEISANQQLWKDFTFAHFVAFSVNSFSFSTSLAETPVQTWQRTYFVETHRSCSRQFSTAAPFISPTETSITCAAITVLMLASVQLLFFYGITHHGTENRTVHSG